MKFAECKFNLSTNAHADPKNNPEAAKTTVVTLTECDVPDDVVRDSAISGQSPRARFQGAWRKNGVPPEVKMTWAEWFGKPQKTVLAVRDMTAEEIRIKAMSDPTFLDQMRRLLAAHPNNG